MSTSLVPVVSRSVILLRLLLLHWTLKYLLAGPSTHPKPPSNLNLVAFVIPVLLAKVVLPIVLSGGH
jgi:hypothetical protein